MAEREGLIRRCAAHPFRGVTLERDVLRNARRCLSNPLIGFEPLLATLMTFRRALDDSKAGALNNGGEGGIRTLDRGLAYTPLAGARLQPLGHLSQNRAQ